MRYQHSISRGRKKKLSSHLSVFFIVFHAMKNKHVSFLKRIYYFPYIISNRKRLLIIEIQQLNLILYVIFVNAPLYCSAKWIIVVMCVKCYAFILKFYGTSNSKVLRTAKEKQNVYQSNILCFNAQHRSYLLKVVLIYYGQFRLNWYKLYCLEETSKHIVLSLYCHTIKRHDIHNDINGFWI